jgi:hypothetical protein
VWEIESLPNSGTFVVVAGAQQSLFRYDPASSTLVPMDTPETGRIVGIRDLPNIGTFIAAWRGLFRYDLASSSLVPVPGPETGPVRIIEGLFNGGPLIDAERGLFRYNPASSSLVPVPGPETGPVRTIQGLSDDSALIDAERGLFRYNPASSTLVSVSGPKTGPVRTIQGLSDDSALIRAEQGLFRYELVSSTLIPISGSETGDIWKIERLPNGSILIGADTGLFRYDPASSTLVSVPSPQIGRVKYIQGLPNGSTLIGADRGAFLGPQAPLATASVTGDTTLLQRLQSGPNAVEVVATFHHVCAPVATELGLNLVASHSGKEVSVAPVRYFKGGSPGPGATSTALAASFVFNQPGGWVISLRQGATTIGQLPAFTVGGQTSVLQWLLATWKWITLGFSMLYATGFALLVGLSNRSAKAQRVLFSDAVWAKFLTWPFFLVRHVPAVQRWVLEPWFQEVRRTTRRDVDFLEPPLTDAAGQQIGGPALLDRLRDTKRIWLQGRSGMGKSSVFAAWERAYFASEDAPDLAQAARRYGFILIMLPVRHYAALPLPEPNKPRSWVIEAVRLRLEQFGFVTREPSLIEAMLTAGHIAIALDGMNEADRDPSLTDFARQFPMVSLLVTSQTAAPQGWELWRLPENISALRNGLLDLWLGPDKSRVLSHRIETEGFAGELVSGYDLRLIADLAGADPQHALLPANRIALYRAILARAQDTTGQPLPLEGLKQLAWKMVTERRRDIRSDDQKLLSPGSIDALS